MKLESKHEEDVSKVKTELDTQKVLLREEIIRHLVTEKKCKDIRKDCIDQVEAMDKWLMETADELKVRLLLYKVCFILICTAN